MNDELGKVIARLNKEVKEGSHWKANHDEVVKKLRRYTCRPDITINKHAVEIADQNRRLDDKTKLAKSLDKANSEMAVEIAELKKQFAAVKYLIDGAYCENSGNNAGEERKWLNHLYRMIDTDNDNQCLQDIKAAAVNEFANEYCRDCTTDYQAQLSNDAMYYAAKLRGETWCYAGRGL